MTNINNILEKFDEKFYDNSIVCGNRGCFGMDKEFCKEDVKSFLRTSLEELLKDKAEEIRDEIIKNFGSYSNGCGCCGDTSVKEESEELLEIIKSKLK